MCCVDSSLLIDASALDGNSYRELSYTGGGTFTDYARPCSCKCLSRSILGNPLHAHALNAVVFTDDLARPRNVKVGNTRWIG